MKTAIIFGSTGLIGSNLLELLIKNNSYSKIKIFTRKSIENNNSKIEIFKVDFNKIEKYKHNIKADDCFFAIGTTRKLTPLKKNYIDIELNLPIRIAKIAKENLVKSFIYVSSGGANANSKNLYLKNKGKAENSIINLKFEFTAIIQPSLLLGNRNEFRLGESIAQFIFKKISFLFISKFKSFKPIKAETVAKAMIKINMNNINDIYFSSDKLEDLGKY